MPLNNLSPLKSPESYLFRIRRQEVFTDTLGLPSEFNSLSPEQRQHRKSLGIARAALSLNEIHPPAERVDSVSETDRSIFKMIGSLDSFYKAQSTLDHFEDQDRHRPHHERTDYEVKRPYIETVAGFNHAMREVIDCLPRVKFSELLDFTTAMFEADKGRADSSRFEQMASAVINGMRHEIAAEQIIGLIPGAEIEYIDPDDQINAAQAERERILSDMSGRDIRVRIGGRSVNIDIKASEKTAEKSKIRSRHPERIIWSGITNEEFGDNLRISPELAAQKAGTMGRSLLRAAFPEKYRTIA